MTDTPQIDDPLAKNGDGTLTWLDRWLSLGGKYFSFLFLISGTIIVYEIVARYVFNAPTMWGHETTMFLCGLLFTFGGNYCLARDKHIRIVLIYGNVKPATKRIMDIVISAVGLLFALMLSYAAYQVAEKATFAPWGEFRLETSGSAWDPAFPAYTKVFLMIMLGVMSLQFLLHLIYHIRRRTDV